MGQVVAITILMFLQSTFPTKAPKTSIPIVEGIRVSPQDVPKVESSMTLILEAGVPFQECNLITCLVYRLSNYIELQCTE